MRLKSLLQLLMLPVLCVAFMAHAQVVKEKTKLLTVTPAPAIYTEEKPNISVDAKHPEFTLKVKSNPTTGYSWFLREYDSNLMVPVKHSFELADRKLMGAPGYELWTFRIKPIGFVVPQQTVIRLVYARPWQGSDTSTQLVFRVSTQAR